MIFQSLKLEKIAKLEPLRSIGVILQFFADLMIGREFSNIQYIAIVGLLLLYFVMGIEAFYKQKFANLGKSQQERRKLFQQ